MNTLAFFAGQPGLPELMIILLVVVLLFGAKRLPEIARSMGRSLNEFKRGKSEVLDAVNDVEKELEADPEKPSKDTSA